MNILQRNSSKNAQITYCFDKNKIILVYFWRRWFFFITYFFASFQDKPPQECFSLEINEAYGGRNKSEITIESCFKWILTSEASRSGMAMLVVDIPSGYVLEQSSANQIVRSQTIPELKDSDTSKPGKTIWYFDSIPTQKRCFKHTVRRYFPVANLTRTRQALLIEPMRPERFFIRVFNSTPLYILSICEVCGSYECPYCPHYSDASVFRVNLIVMMFVIFLLFRIQ